MKRRLLVVDDDRLLCHGARDRFAGPELEVLAAHDAATALAACAEGVVDVVVLDQRLPDGDGRELCEPILRLHPHAKIIFVTAYPSFESAVGALKAGARDYLCKPFEMEELALALGLCLEALGLERVERLETYRRAQAQEEAVLVGAAGLAGVREVVERAAAAEFPVLITGETGTGKNLAAKAIHYGGPRRTKPFVQLNCAALPENLIEAELFGWERGAFTGAAGAREGVLEMAEGGTLFLDEIGELPSHLQAKLLSALEEKELRRLGGRVTRPVDARVVAATNADLEARLADGRFRADLFYRLNVIRLHLPPLRDRKSDIPEICARLLQRMGGRRGAPRLVEGEVDRLMAYRWPGNVRELKNVLERARALHGDPLRPSELLDPGSLSLAGVPNTAPEAPEHEVTLDALERRHVEGALSRNDGNLARTARALGISLSTLKRKVRQYRLDRSGPSDPF